MEQLPPTSRNQLLLALTDLKHIQFLRMTRQQDGGFSFALSPESNEVLASLCAVMLLTPEQVRMRWMVANRRCRRDCTFLIKGLHGGHYPWDPDQVLAVEGRRGSWA